MRRDWRLRARRLAARRLRRLLNRSNQGVEWVHGFLLEMSNHTLYATTLTIRPSL
jgi:hypothetical protein